MPRVDKYAIILMTWIVFFLFVVTGMPAPFRGVSVPGGPGSG